MKLSRPVLAAATAGAIIAGSYTAADSTPVFAPLVEETTDTVADTGAPSETEADTDSDAGTDAQATTDEEASNAVSYTHL